MNIPAQLEHKGTRILPPLTGEQVLQPNAQNATILRRNHRCSDRADAHDCTDRAPCSEAVDGRRPHG